VSRNAISDGSGTHFAYGVLGYFNWGSRCVGITTPYDLRDYNITVNFVDVGLSGNSNTRYTSGLSFSLYSDSPNVFTVDGTKVFPSPADEPHLCRVSYTLTKK